MKKTIFLFLLLISITTFSQNRFPYNGPDYEYDDKDPYLSEIIKDNPYTGKKIKNPSSVAYIGIETKSKTEISMKFEIGDNDEDYRFEGTLIIKKIKYLMIGQYLAEGNYGAALYLDPNRPAVAEIFWSENTVNEITGYIREDEDGEFDDRFRMKKINKSR